MPACVPGLEECGRAAGEMWSASGELVGLKLIEHQKLHGAAPSLVYSMGASEPHTVTVTVKWSLGLCMSLKKRVTSLHNWHKTLLSKCPGKCVRLAFAARVPDLLGHNGQVVTCTCAISACKRNAHTMMCYCVFVHSS